MTHSLKLWAAMISSLSTKPRRSYIEFLIRSAEEDAKVYEANARVARLHAQELRVRLTLLGQEGL
jgi:hypothetical protein